MKRSEFDKLIKMLPQKTQQDKDLAKVKQDGYNLIYVKKQTPEICMAAVKQDSGALSYVNKFIFIDNINK